MFYLRRKDARSKNEQAFMFLPVLVAFLAHGSENHACTGDNLRLSTAWMSRQTSAP